MECNKDEAIRAKEIAETKMANSDFLGAQKLALKAQKLYPQLENISQLLAVCDVHSSAQNSIVGAEKDWYEILQVDRFSDELTIKKKYRRLALALHPDKNRFPGAEAAFKLIGEANMVLSDPVRKSVYDSKIRFGIAAAPRPPGNQVNRDPPIVKQNGGQNNIQYGFTAQSSGPNQYHGMQSKAYGGQEPFWTCCPLCGKKFQLGKAFVKRALRCTNCERPFVAYDIGAQGFPLGSKLAQVGSQNLRPEPSVCQQKEVPDHHPFKMGATSNIRFAAPDVAFHGSACSKTLKPNSNYQTGCMAENIGDFSVKANNSKKTKSSSWGKRGTQINDDAFDRESGDQNVKCRKRGKKTVGESSESYDSLGGIDGKDAAVGKDNIGSVANAHSGVNAFGCTCKKEAAVGKENADSGGMHSGVNVSPSVRRSARLRQDVLYSKHDDDFVNPPKGSHSSKLPDDSKEDKTNAVAQEGRNPSKFSADTHNVNPKMPSVSVENEGPKIGQAVNISATGPDTTEVMDHSGSDSDLDGDVYDCPDPEFNDFDKAREESCFAVGQIWACYDTTDNMPTYYAQVKKVTTKPEFKLRITWLEANPEEEAEENWVDEGLPVGCGRFKYGETDNTTARLMFSHQVQCEKGKRKGCLFIYPRGGQIWAIFKDWDMRWSSNPGSHMPFKYEIVEVLSDFIEGVGIRVAYLHKVGGFVSLFKRSAVDSFVIQPNSLFRFSHEIPSFKMSGSERSGVPEGSFELDPAAIPNPDDFISPDKFCVDDKFGCCSSYSHPKTTEPRTQSVA